MCFICVVIFTDASNMKLKHYFVMSWPSIGQRVNWLKILVKCKLGPLSLTTVLKVFHFKLGKRWSGGSLTPRPMSLL